MKLRIKEITPGCMPKQIDQGDWIDLRTAKEVVLDAGEYEIIPLGIAVELPEGYEAHIVPRSSTFGKWGILLANSVGIIDNSYRGDSDEWGFPAYAEWFTVIPKGTRIAQFRIVENQPKFEIVEVETLGNDDRGGFGSTGD